MSAITITARPMTNARLENGRRSTSGSATRRMGRLDSDESPVSVARTPLPAIRPHKRRMVVPLLPQSHSALFLNSGAPSTVTAGSASPRRP